EFHDAAGASHHGGKAAPPPEEPVATSSDENVIWLADAEKELRKVPFFVRGKARRNTETYAVERGVQEISVDTLYEAKAHFAR
ncbi:MAG: ferredoxin:protochlorophyllide reductase (ATP-dependent) subunit B, partial [Pseudomonadota bacterium]